MNNARNEKIFNQYINLENLESINEYIINNFKAFEKAYVVKPKRINKKTCKYHFYNLLSTCILRIRETSTYLSIYSFKKKNKCGQAFDFYEFISCLSIVFGCVESVLSIFGIVLKESFNEKVHFIKSNKTKENDYNFFKFIRSAAVAHPEQTTHYPNITEGQDELYPYAVWTDNSLDFLINKEDKNADITLLSWLANNNDKYKRYYLYIDEFYSFANSLVKALSLINPYLKEVVLKYTDKHRCKRLKDAKAFSSYHEYLMYLRRRLMMLCNNKNDFADGGLLLADNILSNKLIGKDFKGYIRKRIKLLRNMMIDDFSSISANTIFQDLDLYKVIKSKCDDAGYINEKFDLCLAREALFEIENKRYFAFYPDLLKFKDHPADGNDAFWATYKLFSSDHVFLDKIKSIQNYVFLTYTDIYELSLELIFEITIINKHGK